VLEVSGKDAQKFLKGMTSKDVEQLGGGYSGVFNATVSMSRLQATPGPR
jgi:folate-binding Fe-S cluster repair protein YgfZ